MVELLEDADPAAFAAAMSFLDAFDGPLPASPSGVCETLALTTTSSSVVSSPIPPDTSSLTAQLLDEHALFSGLFPPSPAPSTPPLTIVGSSLNIAPLAVDFFPLGIEYDRPVAAERSRVTAQPFSPSAVGSTVSFVSSPGSMSYSSSTSSDVPVSQKSKPKRPKNYNSNKARDERRLELMYLRRKVTEMERELERIQQKKPRVTARPLPPSTTRTSGDVVKKQKPGVWEEIAARQLEERRRVESENEQLKAVLETQIKIAKSLEAILNKRSTLRGMEACGIGKRKRVFATNAEANDKVIFDGLLLRVEGCYLEVERLFEGLGIGSLEESFRDAHMRDGENGMYMEIFANNVLPFTVHNAGKAAWKFFAHNVNHIPFRQYYGRTRDNMNVTEDTIIENIGLELHANNTKALFRVKQVLRRYVEEERVVIVWSSIIDPIEFSDKPFSGFYFRENGYMLLKKPKTHDPSEYSVLKTCYVITPDFTSNSTLGENDEVIGELTEFVLSGTAASISASHQVIENMLLSEALKTPMSRV